MAHKKSDQILSLLKNSSRKAARSFEGIAKRLQNRVGRKTAYAFLGVCLVGIGGFFFQKETEYRSSTFSSEIRQLAESNPTLFITEEPDLRNGPKVGSGFDIRQRISEASLVTLAKAEDSQTHETVFIPNSGVRFSLSIPQSTAGTLKIGKNAGMEIAITQTGAKLAVTNATQKGNRVFAENIYPSTDLLRQIVPTGMKEDLILKDANAPKSFSYEITVPKGILAELTGRGEILYRDAAGTAIMRHPKPYLVDANGKVGTDARWDLKKSKTVSG